MKAGNASPANMILFGPVRRGNSFYHCSMQRKLREGCRSRILAAVLATSRPPPQRAVQSRAVSARQDYLRARRRQGCKQFNPPSRNRFGATPRATALLFPKQRMLSRWARKKEWRKKRRDSRRRGHETLFSDHYFVGLDHCVGGREGGAHYRAGIGAANAGVVRCGCSR